MFELVPGTRVRLLTDMPEHFLSTGSIGTVCSRWFLPEPTLEVEFPCELTGEPTRVLLAQSQVVSIDTSHAPDSPEISDQEADDTSIDTVLV